MRSGDYEYTFVHGPLASSDLIEELSTLYSHHYGIWSADAPTNPGKPVRLSASMLRQWLCEESKIALAKFESQVIGYAIAIQVKVQRYGVISWVTQLVIHEDHRKRDVGKTLLFSIWGFSDHFGWGLVTANPYAVRALEKATRRRCMPGRIKRNQRKLAQVGIRHTPYISLDTTIEVTNSVSRIDTHFFLDHSQLTDMLAAVTNAIPWALGELSEGWEWFAFTFHDQEQIKLTPLEIRKMIDASDQVAKQAYSRMLLNSSHRWAQHTEKEVALILKWCNLSPGMTVLDVGCGSGRHVVKLAEHSIAATGVDYISELIRDARSAAERSGSEASATFREGDARIINLGEEYDAVICIYDVVGSYADDSENRRVLANCSNHLRTGGILLLSVMNFELTEFRAKFRFSLADEPSRLSDLAPSRTMEST